VVGGLLVSGAGEERVNGKYVSRSAADVKRKEYQKELGSAWMYWNVDTREWIMYDREYRNGSVLYWSPSDVDDPWHGKWNAPRGVLLPVPTVKPLHEAEADTNEFCNGIGTDMFMGGFVSLFDPSRPEGPCLVMFLSSWMIDSYPKFIVAWLASLVAGVFCEAILAARARVGKYLGDARHPSALAMKLSLYAGHRVAGYLVMLLAMTYSTEIFIAVVLGLTTGHLLFNMRKPVAEGETACCAPEAPESPKKPGGRSLGSPWREKQDPWSEGGTPSPRGPKSQWREDLEARKKELEDCTSYSLDFSVSGMTCNACSNTVTRAVEAVPQVVSVKVNLQNGTAAVQILDKSEEAAQSAVREAIEDVGFGAEILESKEDTVSADIGKLTVLMQP